MIVLRVCTSCEPGFDPVIAEKLEAAIVTEGFTVPVQVLPQLCMNGCSRPSSLALQGSGRATYFFSDIDLEADRDDIIRTLHAYIESPEGWIEDAHSCGRLRYCLTGRVPALTEISSKSE